MPVCRDLFITCAHNVYSRTLSSLEDNLKMASKGRNMQLSSIVIKYTLIDIVVFDYILFPRFNCISIPLFFYLVLSHSSRGTRRSLALSTDGSVLCCQPSCHRGFQCPIIFSVWSLKLCFRTENGLFQLTSPDTIKIPVLYSVTKL